MFIPFRSLTAQLAFIAVIAAGVFLIVPLFDAVPEWAALSLLILGTAAACYTVVFAVRWQRCRTDGARVLADASVPLDQQTGYSKHHASPDRRFVAVTTTHNVRMSIWIEDLLLCDVERNQWILHIPHPYAVADLGWVASNRLRFDLNRYPDGGTWIGVLLNIEAQTAEVGAPPGAPTTIAFARLVAWLNAFFARGQLKRYFDTSAPGTLALPGARASRAFTLSMVLLTVVPIAVVMFGGWREAHDDTTLQAPVSAPPPAPVATVTTSAGRAAESAGSTARSVEDLIPGGVTSDPKRRTAIPGIPDVPPEPPPSPPSRGVRVGGNIRAPAKVRDVAAVYPPQAMQARVQGVVILEVTIGPDGSVSGARVLRSIPMLDEAAVAAVKQWRYMPTLIDGVPSPVIMTVTVQFTLR